MEKDIYKVDFGAFALSTNANLLIESNGKRLLLYYEAIEALKKQNLPTSAEMLFAFCQEEGTPCKGNKNAIELLARNIKVQL